MNPGPADQLGVAVDGGSRTRASASASHSIVMDSVGSALVGAEDAGGVSSVGDDIAEDYEDEIDRRSKRDL